MKLSHLFKLGLLVIAATLFSSCLSAPARPDPWWYHPCNTDLPRVRHGRSTNDGLTNIRNQLKIFIKQLQNNMKKVSSLYSIKKGPAGAKATPNAKLQWLKMRKMLLTIKNSQSQNQTLEKFYNSIQYFAGTMEVLRHVKIQTSALSFDQSERDSIYENITYQMRSLLCEVHDRISDPKGVTLKKINIPASFNKPLDLTAGHLIDVNFFKKTITFFKRTQKLLAIKSKKVKKNSAVKHKKRT